VAKSHINRFLFGAIRDFKFGCHHIAEELHEVARPGIHRQAPENLSNQIEHGFDSSVLCLCEI